MSILSDGQIFLAQLAEVSAGGVPVGLIVILVLVIAAAIAVAVAVLKVKNGVRQISRNLFGTDSFSQGLNNQKKEMSETPRSLQAMTRLCLPRIQRDFPEFDYEDYKQKAQTVLRSYMNAVEEKNPDLLCGECTKALKDSVKSIVEDLSARGYTQSFDDIVIHRTEISRYTKDGATARILFVSSVGSYSYTTDGSGKVVYGTREMKTQSVYETELVYVQNVDRMADGSEGLGLNCPNCGAPIKNLGHKFCEYCGTGITEINIRAWRFSSVREQTTTTRPY